MLKSIPTSNILHLHIGLNNYLSLSPRWKDEDAYLNSTRLYFIESGSGYLRTEEETIPLEPGYAYIIPSCMHFAYGCSGMKKLFFHIKLTASEPIDLLEGLGRICRITYKQEDLQTLLACREKTDCFSMMKIQSILFDTICKAAEAYNLPLIYVKTHSEFINQAVQLIQAAPSLALTGKSIAAALFTSESKLRNAFKEELNMPLGKYIDLCVFLKARALLSDPKNSIEQISRQLGFCDQFYFSRRFKQRYHMTPTQYRKSLSDETT